MSKTFIEFMQAAKTLEERKESWISIPRDWWAKKDIFNYEVRSIVAHIYDDGFRYTPDEDGYCPEMNSKFIRSSANVLVYPKTDETESMVHEDLSGFAMIIKIGLKGPDGNVKVLEYDDDCAAEFSTWSHGVDKIMACTDFEVMDSSNVNKFFEAFPETDEDHEMYRNSELLNALTAKSPAFKYANSHYTTISDPTVHIGTTTQYATEEEIRSACEQAILDVFKEAGVQVKEVKACPTVKGWNGPIIGYSSLVVTL